ncbi:hypothetical protein HJC10_21745 [Corallococcus exiguus]|uniref:hypothetical protein n=1 Tax=Corallococcus exiguus TaxID=83462 RepID=UPI000EA250E7|nr:hypothetical protein [Corallococcus exiguus]NNB96738.1 hypothetical protein [Corallococcus exiguus]NNC05465.1 hypothetical protein [Corallococcus exiguus]NPC75921.1 hypothetical protein [Corallococcus exiguus]RKI39890.1 hypothetical protein D7Y27_21205 [Corallococcus sp. AB004]
MKVLVIPEDPTRDQYILKPIVEKLFEDLGRKARVEVLKDPHLRGTSEALDKRTIESIVAENPMENLFLLMVDRDGDRMRNSHHAAGREADHPHRLIACLAREEVEVWMLALHRDELGAAWAEVRAHTDPKEQYADPFLRQKGWLMQVGSGRKRAMQGLGSQWQALLTVCPELKDLRDRLRAWLDRTPA